MRAMARRKADGFGDHPSPRSAFLGALRSELDDSAELHADFQALEEAVAATRAAYLGFRLTPEEAGQVFSMLRLTSADQREWTLGSTSGDWYCRETGMTEWYAVEPPVGIDPDDRVTPDWARDGISTYLDRYGSRNAEASGVSGSAFEVPAAEAAGTGPLAPAESFKVASAAPLVPARSLGEDSAWLLEEWTQQAPQVAPLRVVEAETYGMPEELPPTWDEESSLQAGLESGEAVAPARRDDDGFTSPEDFFLRPDGQ